MPPVGFEPTISAGERPQTYALERAATGNGNLSVSTWVKQEPLSNRKFPEPLKRCYKYISLYFNFKIGSDVTDNKNENSATCSHIF
jgi:hypothetical protein